MKITKEQVEYVAALARLELEPGEVERMAGQLDTILSYVEKLNELDTAGVAAAAHSSDLSNAFREDEVLESLPRDKALQNAPRSDEETFVVPRII